MPIYLSSDTIQESYETLTRKIDNTRYSSQLFHFLILKAIGFSPLNYIDLDSQQVKNKIKKTVEKFAGLFLDPKYFKENFSFINPLNMKEWGSNPKESLDKWSSTRFKNNIVGGGTQWAPMYELDDKNRIKEKLNGVKKNFEDKPRVEVLPLAIWLRRFEEFDNKKAASELINDFYNYFQITEYEKNLIFTNNNTIPVKYSENRISSEQIRSWIGNPKNVIDWYEKTKEVDVNYMKNINEKNSDVFTHTEIASSNKNEEYYLALLNKANQMIFMGAPGTSKSYMVGKIANHFDKVLKVQFHPQYSYQEFIGGNTLKNNSIVYKNGVFIDFLNKALNDPEHKYLVDIEEINRANVSQVFGELIQLLDRKECIKLNVNDSNGNMIEKTYYLPENLKILGTMNTTDRTVGRIDFAIKRRFYQIHFNVDYNLLIDKVFIEDNSISISDLLKKINSNLVTTLNDAEMVIGHAIFLKSQASHDGTIVWSKEDFCNLFNYVVVPIVNDYCGNNLNLIQNILGKDLPKQKEDEAFYKAVKEFLE